MALRQDLTKESVSSLAAVGEPGYWSDHSLRIEDIDEVRNYIHTIDFTAMMHKMSDPDQGLGWSWSHLTYVEGQYKNWLFLQRKYEDFGLVPSYDIDQMWHSHILDTHAYHRDCARIFGCYYHHYPYFGVGGEDARQELYKRWDRVQELYESEFGEEITDFEEEEEEEM